VVASRDGVTDEAQWHQSVWYSMTGSGTATAPVKTGTRKRFRFSEGGFTNAARQHAWFGVYTLVANGRGEAILFATEDESVWKKHLPEVQTMVDGTEPAAAKDGGAADEILSIAIAPDRPGWFRAEDPATHVVTFVPPGAGNAANCALFLPPSEHTIETPEAF